MSTKEELLDAATRAYGYWEKRIDLGRARIEVSVGKTDGLPALTKYGKDHKKFGIVLNPRLGQNDPAKVYHVIGHELVHIAYLVRFGDDKARALEWLTDQVALLLSGESKRLGD